MIAFNNNSQYGTIVFYGTLWYFIVQIIDINYTYVANLVL